MNKDLLYKKQYGTTMRLKSEEGVSDIHLSLNLKKVRVIILLISTLLVAGCNNEDYAYKKSLQKNTKEQYQSFLQKYPTSKYVPEIQYRKTLAFGSIYDLADYLSFYGDQNDEWTNEIRDTMMSILDRTPMHELIGIWRYSRNTILIEEIEFRLWQDENSAWAIVEYSSFTEEEILACQKYLSLYEHGAHSADAKKRIKVLQKIEKDISTEENKKDGTSNTNQHYSEPQISEKKTYLPFIIGGKTYYYELITYEHTVPMVPGASPLLGPTVKSSMLKAPAANIKPGKLMAVPNMAAKPAGIIESPIDLSNFKASDDSVPTSNYQLTDPLHKTDTLYIK